MQLVQQVNLLPHVHGSSHIFRPSGPVPPRPCDTSLTSMVCTSRRTSTSTVRVIVAISACAGRLHRRSMELLGSAHRAGVKKPHHCTQPDSSGLLDSVQMGIKFVKWILLRISMVVTSVPFVWLKKAQYLLEVFSSFYEHPTLIDSGTVSYTHLTLPTNREV